MPVMISLLRAVNVGGRNKVDMDVLQSLHATQGFRKVRTLLNSGNAVFQTSENPSPELAARLEEAIQARCRITTPVLLRTFEEWKEVIARNPFRDREDIDPSKLLVVFLSDTPSPEAVTKVRLIKTDPDEFYITGREFFMYFPHGMARPRVNWTTIERALKVTGTGRNWNTVTKLAELARELAGA